MVHLRAVLAVAVAASLVAPIVVAHEGGDGALDVVASPETPRVGEMVDLTYYLYEDGALVPHVDADVQVTQDGAPLLTLSSVHEHDGVHHTTIRFTEPGSFSYTVVAETADGTVERTVTGEVLPAANRSDVDVRVDAPGRVDAGEPIGVSVRVTGPDDGDDGGATTGSCPRNASCVVRDRPDGPSARAWVRLYREPTGKLVRRAEVGMPGGGGGLETAVNVPGTYRLQVEVYPTNGSSFAPVVERRTVEVEAGRGPVDPDPGLDPVLVGSEAVPGNRTLRLRVDPAAQVGPLADLKVDALLLEDGHPGGTTRYTVHVEGPRGATILAQEDSLQPDGIAEWFVHTPVPGTYGIRVAASGPDGAETTRTASYTVVPPTEPGLPGTVQPTFGATLDGAGPHEMGLAFEDATGQPMEHVEADLEAYAPGEAAPRWTTKLHTHAHDVTWSAAFEDSGGHYLKVNPSPQSPSAEQIHAPGGPTAELGFGFHVDAPAAADDAVEPVSAPGEPTPWPAILALLAVAAAAVWWRRVRSR